MPQNITNNGTVFGRMNWGNQGGGNSWDTGDIHGLPIVELSSGIHPLGFPNPQSSLGDFSHDWVIGDSGVPTRRRNLR